MIGKLVLTRIEPCFTANKPACGEASRVKKDSTGKPVHPVPQMPNDTFTSSKSVENQNQKTSEKEQKKSTHEGN